MVVCSFAVPWIEGVVADHVECFFGKVVLDHVVEVFVVAVGEVHVVEAASWFVDSVFGLVFGDVVVGIELEIFGENHFV